MRRSLQRRLDVLARKIYSAERPPRFLWKEPTETEAQVQARIRAMIASGEADANDKFCTFGWLPPEDQGADG
jgi:hypothetical protein